jgi:hypothetical protein
MGIRIIPKAQQGQGAFNGGQIVENKPIGFPQDRSAVGPYSNLFYWAHAKAVQDSTIGLHPHQGFEICSFVLKGEIRHFDTQLREWRPLQAGDVQIIRAGNGISHSEFMAAGAEMFQIWFDPNLNKTLGQKASYDDYRRADFPATEDAALHRTTLVGPGSPFRMDTPRIQVQELRLQAGTTHHLPIEAGQICSAYVLEGAVALNGENAQTSDFIIAQDIETLEIQALADTWVFLISSPQNPGYQTYGTAMRARTA